MAQPHNLSKPLRSPVRNDLHQSKDCVKSDQSGPLVAESRQPGCRRQVETKAVNRADCPQLKRALLPLSHPRDPSHSGRKADLTRSKKLRATRVAFFLKEHRSFLSCFIMSCDLVGTRISLISRKDIRWEGVLVQVDKENASVTLQNGELSGEESVWLSSF